jgi:SAM-dependent methyltransferase
MTHRQQLEFIAELAELFPDKFRKRRVLEIGSQNVNGTIRHFFEDCDYTGIDVAPGPDVDIVCEGQNYDAPDGSFDVVIACEVMEHNPYWAETTANMIRLCKPNGMVVVTCATLGRAEHGTTRSVPAASPLTLNWYYYRNLTHKDFIRSGILAPLGEKAFVCEWFNKDLNLVGFKVSADPRIAKQLTALRRHYYKQILSSWRSIKTHIKAMILRRRDGGY